MYIFVIKPLREKRNISLYSLSKFTGISRTYLRSLENNQVFNPTMQILYKIANALNVSIKDLFYYGNDIEKLRAEMHSRIEIFGLDSKEVLEVSQIIDLLINVKMKES
jgi:transcriptional regulator with XRE-family HTH domain|nr:MAG TPA: Helix-turn-helix XRE-family like protein [Caudoviricetes sp.]